MNQAYEELYNESFNLTKENNDVKEILERENLQKKECTSFVK